MIIGTNIIRECSQLCESHNITTLPDGWKTAIDMIETKSIGVVKTTRQIKLHPMEVKTVTGFVRKTKNTESALTEPLPNEFENKTTVCPRVVSLENPGKTSRVPVRICNLSARIITIPENSKLCQLQEVKVIREASIIDENNPVTGHINQQQAESEKENKEDKNTYGVDLEDSN